MNVSIEELDKEFTEVKKQTAKKFLALAPDLGNIDSVIQSRTITASESYIEPVPIISIDGNRLATLGNISMITGKAKSRKTFLISLLLAYGLRTKEGSIVTFSFPEDKRLIILIDTEQADYDIQRVVKRINAIAGDSANFICIGLRAYSPADRIKIINRIIETTPELALLVIDGIRDLVSDINNPQEATEISTWLLSWTQAFNIHIMTVLHQNKGDNNARGHVGAELTNKCESVFSVEKDGDISKVSAEQCRGKDFSPFAFSVDEHGLPFILNDWAAPDKSISGGRPKAITPYDLPESQHKEILKAIFSIEPIMQYANFTSNIINQFDKNAVKVSLNKSRDFVTYYLEKGFITKQKIQGKSYEGYCIK